MTQLGERFREAREARGISITEASTATRILPRYLQAIEAGDVASLPGDVYARGFVRNYAQLLGLPVEEMVALYRQERGEPTAPIRIVPAAVPPRSRSCLVPSFFVSFFSVLLLVVAFWLVLNLTGMLRAQQVTEGGPTSSPIPATPTEFPTPTELPPGTTASPLPPAQTPVPPTADPLQPTADPRFPTPTTTTLIVPGATPVPAVTPTPEAPVVVEVTVTNDSSSVGSWFTVNADGITVYNQLLGPGGAKRWIAQREVFLNIGDTSVVQLLLNGQPVEGFPGAVRSRPRRLTCDPTGCR